MNERSPNSPKLEVGTRVHFDGDFWIIEGFEGGAIRLRGVSGPSLISLRALVSTDDFEVLPDDRIDHSDEDGTEDTKHKATSSRADIENLPVAVANKAREMALHIQEVETGFRSDAISGEAAAHALRPEYDPESTTLTERVLRKAREIGMSESALWKLRQRYTKSGLYGLVDQRMLRASTTADRLDPKLREALLQVLHEHTEKSNPSRKRIIDLATRRVREEHGPDDVKIPGRATLYRAVQQLSQNMGTFGSSKNRRSVANRPRTAYRRFTSSRPGEVVLIDTTTLDVYALDPTTLRWVGLKLTLALDLFTQSILAWRFTPRGTKGVDAALLLRDIITPKSVRPGWPDDTRWPYVGIPETIVIDAFGGTGDPLENSSPAGIPIVNPETVVVDRGRIYQSETFVDACRVLGVNVLMSRPYTPTDKAQIERAFRTIRQGLLEALPGYKGPDVWSRGKDVEKTAFYYVDEIETLFAEWVIRVYQRSPHSGLHLPGAPKHNPTPNEMYDYGLATAGFLYVPPDPDLYRELLPIAWRKISHEGVRRDRLLYDSPALDAYRGEPYPFGNPRSGGIKKKHGEKWPIRYDPRDISCLHFKDPYDGSWHELKWVHAPSNVRPFDDTRLAYAKARLVNRGGRVNDYDERDVAKALEEMFSRLNLDAATDPRERRIIADAFIRQGQLARDRGELALPGPVSPHDQDRVFDDPDDAEDDFGWGSGEPVDISSIEAFPAFSGDDADVDFHDD